MEKVLTLGTVVDRVKGVFPISVNVSEISWGFKIEFLVPINFVRLYHMKKLAEALHDYPNYEPRACATVDEAGQPVAYVELFRY